MKSKCYYSAYAVLALAMSIMFIAGCAKTEKTAAENVESASRSTSRRIRRTRLKLYGIKRLRIWADMPELGLLYPRRTLIG